MILQHRLAVLVVGAALAVLGARIYDWPVDRPAHGSALKLAWSEAPVLSSGARGWTWPHGTPGYELGHDEAHWNLSLLRPEELARADAVARRRGVQDLRVLNASRTGPHDVSILVAGADATGATCVGALVPRHPLALTCQPALGPRVALVAVDARAPMGGGLYPVTLVGVVRGDVTRVEVGAPGFAQTLYRRGAGNPSWGTFSVALAPSYFRMPGPWARDLETPAAPAPAHPWQARLAFYGRRGLLAGAPLLYDRPTERLVVVR